MRDEYNKQQARTESELRRDYKFSNEVTQTTTIIYIYIIYIVQDKPDNESEK